jgi:hypothetical protein
MDGLEGESQSAKLSTFTGFEPVNESGHVFA